MYYTIDKHLFRQKPDYQKVILRLSLIIIGLLIGASLGLWISVKTMPLPTIQTNNYYRTP